MARFYQTAERKYLEDGIYKPPVELMSQVIAARDTQVDQNLNNLNIIKDNMDTNIKYWDIDKDQAQSLQQEWDNLIDNAAKNIMEHPLQNNIGQTISDLQRDWKRSLRQGGNTYNLQANLDAKNQSDADAAAIKDKVYGQWQNKLFEEQYKESRYDENGNWVPLNENNIYNYHNYGEYVENVNLFDTFSKRIKERTPHETQSTYFNNTKGISTTTSKTFRDKKEIADIMNNDIAKNLDPDTYNKMKRDDELAKKFGYNGGHLWLNDDGTVNTNGVLWQQQVREQQDVYFKNDIKSSSSIFDHDLYNGYYGIKKKNEDGTYTMSSNFVPDSVIHQNGLTKAYVKYIQNGGKPLEHNGYTFGVKNGQITFSNSKYKDIPLGSSLYFWYQIGQALQTERENPSTTAYSESRNSDGSTTKKYLGEYYNDEIQMMKAPEQAFNKAVSAFNRGIEFTFAGNGTKSRSIGLDISDYNGGIELTKRTKYSNNKLPGQTAGELKNSGADIPDNIPSNARVLSAIPVKGEYYYTAYDSNGQVSSDFGELHIKVKFKNNDNTYECIFPIDMPDTKFTEGENATIKNE